MYERKLPPVEIDMNAIHEVRQRAKEEEFRTFASPNIINPQLVKVTPSEDGSVDMQPMGAPTPAYYREMEYEPIEVIQSVMTDEQFEGFLWGNIIKYAMRYGKKEDKVKTAEKIENYARWLKELNNK